MYTYIFILIIIIIIFDYYFKIKKNKNALQIMNLKTQKLQQLNFLILKFYVLQ